MICAGVAPPQVAHAESDRHGPAPGLQLYSMTLRGFTAETLALGTQPSVKLTAQVMASSAWTRLLRLSGSPFGIQSQSRHLLMTRFLVLFLALVATLGFGRDAVASGGTYTATANANKDNPGTITVSSNGGAISTVVVKLKGVVQTEGTHYTKTFDGSRVTIMFIVAVVKDDEVQVTGQCAVSGAHDGELHNSPDWTLQ